MRQFRRQTKPRTWILVAGLLLLSVSGIVGVASSGLFRPASGGAADLAGATEAEVIAALGQSDLVLSSQQELRVLVFCYKSLQYKWVAGGTPQTGWMDADQLPLVGQKAYWYERHLP